MLSAAWDWPPDLDLVLARGRPHVPGSGIGPFSGQTAN